MSKHNADSLSAELITEPGADVPGLKRSFWEQRWASVHGADQQVIQHPNQTLADIAQQLTPGTALDAGCGQGTDALYLAEHGWKVTAVDFADSALEFGRQQANSRGAQIADQIDWQQQDLNNWTAPESAYDLVTAHYLHGVAHREQMFRRLAAAVRPGGTLLIVGNHPFNVDISGGTMPPAVFFTASDVTRVLDNDRWTLVTTTDDLTRDITGGDGRVLTLRSAYICAKRR